MIIYYPQNYIHEKVSLLYPQNFPPRNYPAIRYAAGSNNQRAINRAYLQKVLQNVIFLAIQGLPFRGNWIPSEDGSDGCEKESNFYQLMLLRTMDDLGMLDIMRRKTNKYTDHHIQDELIKLLGLIVTCVELLWT